MLWPFARTTGSRNDEVITALFDELARQGFVEGKNLTVDYRAWTTNLDLISEYAAEFAQAHVDVIAAGGDTAIRAAQKVTRTIPIFATTDDMVILRKLRSIALAGLYAAIRGMGVLISARRPNKRGRFSRSSGRRTRSVAAPQYRRRIGDFAAADTLSA